MKKLILASVASNIIGQTQAFFPKPFNEITLGVVPTAANGEEGDKSWLTNELDVLKNLGFKLVEINLEGKTTDALREECKNIDALFVTGGNTYYLLYHVQQSGFNEVVEELVDRGVIYVGSSAGALLACPTIEISRDLVDTSVVSLTDYSGLKLVDFVILPHIDQKKYKGIFDEIIAEWKTKPYLVMGLTDNQAVLVTDNYTELIEAK